MYPDDSPLYESPMMDQLQFSEKSIRMGFIRKVYGILLCQLLITLAVVSLLVFEPNSREFAQRNHALWIIALVMTIICIIALVCCTSVRRTFPTNFIMLGIFTLCEAFLIGTVSSTYNADDVVIAMGICAVVVFGLTVFSFQTKWDFTLIGGFLFVLLLVLMLFGFICIFIKSSILNLFYASLGALIFSVYIVFDTQMMMGGNHKYSISPEEYIFAALNLYLDIINLFMYILQIVAAARK